jgi:hypothetical protein
MHLTICWYEIRRFLLGFGVTVMKTSDGVNFCICTFDLLVSLSGQVEGRGSSVPSSIWRKKFPRRVPNEHMVVAAKVAVVVALLSAPAQAFYSAGRSFALSARMPSTCALSGLRMDGAAEQEAAIRAAKELARMKAKASGAKPGMKRLGTIRLPGSTGSQAMQLTSSGRRLGTGPAPGVSFEADVCILLARVSDATKALLVSICMSAECMRPSFVEPHI